VQIAFNLGGAIGSVGLAALMDTRYQRVTAGLSFVGAVLALIWLADIPSDLPVAVVVGGLVGVTLVGAQTVLYGLAPRCYSTSVRGRRVGAAVMAGRIGSIVGPLLAAAMIGSGEGMGVVWRMIPIIVIAAVCTVLLVSRTRWEA
jgi:MFS transporter, AAHS family, 3-hydroxyphenylpropionic acid transporter